MNATFHTPPMPVITTSGLAALSSMLPVFAAAATIATPGFIAAYTAFGASMAAFLMYSYLRVRMIGNFWSQAFTCLSALFVGWLLPEPLAWGFSHMGWIRAEVVESMPLKAWGCIAMACGLSAPTLVLVVIYWAQQKLPGLFKVREEDVVATVQVSDKTTVAITTRKTLPPTDPVPAQTAPDPSQP